MRLEVIDTGYLYADGGAMFGAIPKSAWKRRYPCDDQNGCVLALRSVLIVTDQGRIILVDTGVDKKYVQKLSWYRFFDMKDLREELLKRDINPEQVTDVVLTHLHFDHCGNPVFPNAVYHISRIQWENLFNPHPLEASSIFKDDFLALKETNRIELIDAAFTLTPEVSLSIFDGHSPGQLVPSLHTPEREYIFAGDVIPLSSHVSPEWISAYDLCPVRSYDEKICLLEDAVIHKKGIIYCHDAYTVCSTVKKAGAFFRPDRKISFITNRK